MVLHTLKKSFIGFLLAYGVVSGNFAFAITDQVINSVDVIPYLGLETARVKFQMPIKYISHLPAKSGREMAVRILFVNLPQSEIETLPLEQLYRLTSKNRVALESVIFENFGGKPSVVLRFKKPIAFKTPEIIKRQTMLISFPDFKVAQAAKSEEKKRVSRKSSKASPTIVGKLMLLGEQALNEKRYKDAIKYYSKAYNMLDYPKNRAALEQLGIAREGNKQYAHAKTLYREFIDLYPRGEDTKRVKKRLSNLGRIQFGEITMPKLTPMPKPKPVVTSKKMSSVKRVRRKTKSNFTGSFSQDYYHSSNNANTTDRGRRSEKSNLHSIISLKWRVQTSRYAITNSLHASHLYNFSIGNSSDFRFNTFGSTIKDKRHGYFATFGRQYSHTAGVFGQFDGLWLGIEGEKIKFNTVAGYPVKLSDRSSVNTGKQFFAFNLELNNFIKNLYAAPYFISQVAEGITDRRALGYELKYSTLHYEGYNLLDYDLLFSKLNILTLRNKYKFKPGTYLTLDFDLRKYPMLAASNAVYSHTLANTISELLDIQSEDEITEFVSIYTGTSNRTSLGATTTLSKIHIQADMTYSSQKRRPTSLDGGVTVPDEESDSQFYTSLNIVLPDIMRKRNTVLIGLRQSFASFYRNTTLFLADRLSLMKSLNLDTRIRFERRSDPDGGTLFKTKPTINLSYRYKRWMRIHSGLGVEWWSWGGESQNDNYQRLSIDFGYKWIF